MRGIATKSALRISLIYLVLTALWIWLSDRIVDVMAQDEKQLSLLQTYKGFLFIISMTLLLYFLLRYEFSLLEKAQGAITLSETRLQLIVSQMPSLLWTMDNDLRLTYLIGAESTADAADLLGKTMYELAGRLGASSEAAVEAHRGALQGNSTHYEYTIGSSYFAARVEPLRSAAGAVIGCIGLSLDVTERKRTEEAEREQRTFAEALRGTAAALSSSLNLDTVLDRVLDNLGPVVSYDSANIMLIRTDVTPPIGETTRVRSASPQFPVDHGPLPLETFNLSEMQRTREPILIEDTQNFPGWVQKPNEEWIRSHVAAPIRVKNQTIGFLTLNSHTPGFFKQEHAERLQVFANQAAIAIQNAQLYTEVLHHTDELEQHVEQRTAELKQAKEQVELILNSTSDMVILAGGDLLIQRTNPAFSHTFGYESDEIRLQPLTILAHPDSVGALKDALQAVVTEREPRRIEITAQTRSGQPFDADLALSPSQNGAGIVCSVRDISALRKTLQREMELNELKARYVSMFSHEFRTPLTIIRVSSDLLEKYDTRLSEKQKAQEFERVRESIQQLIGLLEDMLMVSRSESGMLQLAPEEFDLDELCDQIVQEIQTATGGKHTFQYSCAGRPAIVHLDPKLFGHILRNLLTNAIKYSPSGGTIHVDVERKEQQTRLIVRDEGVGIPDEALPHLFEPFYRAPNAARIAGTGLGLAIVKLAVDLHHGTITVESKEGEGTTFTAVLPDAA